MNYKSYNDNELIYLIRENDDDSLDILFKKYRPIIISLCNYYYSRIKDRGADYNDLVQEANISLYQAYLKYDDKLGVIFYTFACSCIRNRLSAYTRTFFNKKNNIINTSISYDDSLFGTYNNYYDMEYDFVTNKNKNRLHIFATTDIVDMEQSAFRFINAVSDYVDHTEPLRRTSTWKEKRFANNMSGNELLDNAYTMVNSL